MKINESIEIGIGHDFDGVLVHKTKAKIANARKYPLKRREEADPLMDAVQSDSRIEDLGIITKRYRWMRRRNTQRVLAETGLVDNFKPGSITFAGGDGNKALYLARWANTHELPVGIIDDRPGEVGVKAAELAVKCKKTPEFGSLIIIAAEASELNHQSVRDFEVGIEELERKHPDDLDVLRDNTAGEIAVRMEEGTIYVIPALGPPAEEVLDHVISLGHAG